MTLKTMLSADCLLMMVTDHRDKVARTVYCYMVREACTIVYRMLIMFVAFEL